MSFREEEKNFLSIYRLVNMLSYFRMIILVMFRCKVNQKNIIVSQKKLFPFKNYNLEGYVIMS